MGGKMALKPGDYEQLYDFIFARDKKRRFHEVFDDAADDAGADSDTHDEQAFVLVDDARQPVVPAQEVLDVRACLHVRKRARREADTERARREQQVREAQWEERARKRTRASLLALPPVPDQGPIRWREVPETGGRVRQPADTNTRNVVERDARIVFVGPSPGRPDDHYYLVDQKGGILSGTGLVHMGFEDFEVRKYEIAGFCANTRKRDSPYFGKSVKEVLHMWDVNRDTGSAKHAAMDDWLQGRPAVTHQMGVGEAIAEPPGGFFAFLRDHPTLQIYRTEWSLFSEEHKVAGQLDAFFFDTATGEWVIVDWKNVANFTTSSYTKGTHALTRDMDDCKLAQYTLQLNVYRHMIELHYGFRVARMIIVNFVPARAHEYTAYECKRVDMEPFFALRLTAE